MPDTDSSHRPVLVSWLASRHDPLDRDGKPGPNLTLLFDPDSPYKDSIDNIVVFYNSADHLPIAQKLEREIKKRSRTSRPEVRLHSLPVNPIDHREMFEQLRSKLQDLREEFPGRELVIHVSPGTPAAHTVWVLLAETGLIEPPFRLVQTLRREDRKGPSPIQPVEIGLETPLRSFQKPSSSPSISDEGSDVRLDPSAYQSNRRREVFARALRYAQLNVPILILGERGTGKSQLADWIRLNSPFRRPENDETPPKVACGQFTGDLVRSEIFGHRKGAFTGATSDRDGLLKTADGDTLFLDEIGDLSQEVQRLLIRAVENNEYTPHGSDEVLTSNFRLIAATNLPWAELTGVLAADFLDRISYFTVEMPPLRDTPEDLPMLWERVLQIAAERAHVSEKIVDRVVEHRAIVVDHLQNHPLPGNFRDLFRLAYHIFAEAKTEDRTAEEAVRRALHNALYDHSDSSREPIGEIRAAFGEGRPLSPNVLDEGPISTSAALNELRRYLAEEIRRLSQLDDDIEDPASICDVSNRSLQKWIRL